MPRLTPAVGAALALAGLSVLVASPPAAADNANNKDVTIRVGCHPGGEGAASVTVDPWVLLLEVGDETTWNLHIPKAHKQWILVEPKTKKSWPYVEEKHEGKAGKAHAKGMKEDPRGDYTYNIKFSCDGKETVIDPRVKVR